ncbi:Anaphase-promoting complex subunit 13 [Teratosphaeria destructans]|uniref:Anaphase-promoting complex subunit 13 n=1 Tax=Teratosphaeria destructans TaxID=418781 RepID=A0A9W7SXR3_9PEZI|nr:Anaphase-promoting complex subunit 13 [Teratosphaeria destructans]
MSRDSSFNPLHLHSPHHADLLEDFTRGALKLPAETISVAPQHRPINPDDEDDVVPDQHAAFGIQRATQKAREPAWKDLGLERLMREGPPVNRGGTVGGMTGSGVGGPR